ncbi:hypothetical protein [Bacillus wiedmannii]|uniref:hypothetical protein n=1 Tax=Bacillus wiedmannii TaxID=1890302 RepID=UPI000BEDEDFE|nr:hypothetical protein [Bacillus wiedmannii]PDZ42491.1 hypothetical protein CON82_29120 [Bacillus wiedmannii]
MKKDKTLQKAIDLGGSARIVAYPSRSALFCFLSVGLARKVYEPKKSPLVPFETFSPIYKIWLV